MERVGDTIVDMLRQHDAASPHAIVGYSTGAYRAFDLVTRCGIAPSVLVSLAGVVNFDMASRDARRYFARRFAEDPGFGTSAEARAAMLDLMVSAGWLADHPQDAARIVGWLSTTTPQALSAELNALATSRDLRPELQRVRARVYARVGSLDRGCPPGWSDEIARLVPRATIDIVLGCGHALLLEDGPGTVEAIKREIDAGASG
jgi:pimeloyl-ACP methyl ester carboxylesterase